jgi:hypothetical protein
MKEHLKKFFTSAAAHHTTMAKLAQSAMDSCEEDDPSREMHKSAMDSHINHAECCAACAKACAKADDSGDLEKIIMPMEVSGVAPTAPSTNIRAVPRFGSREMPTQPVDADFAHLAQIEGGQ